MNGSVSSAEKQLERLRNQINWVTRISTALSSTENVEDVLSIVLASLLSPTGLGYSRVLYFEHDDAFNQLKGRYALFHESKDAMRALAQELEEEAALVEGWTKSYENSEPEDSPLGEVEFISLTSSAPWIIVFQRLHRHNAVTEQLEKLRFATWSGAKKAKAKNIMQEVSTWRKPRLMEKARIAPRFPPSLLPLVADHFVMVPIATAKGLRAMLIVDRHLEEDQTLSTEELRELDWFARQASLAVENAEIRTDLSRSYNEVKEFDQLKTNFLSVISHELRTPLTSMSGFVDLILDERVGEIGENQRTLLKRVQKNTSHLIHLVNDLIEVAEIEAEGTVEVRMCPVEPLTVLLDTLPRLEQRRRENNVRVEPVIDCKVPLVMTDERALGRIFFHLIDNALKFSPDNSVVTVRFRVEEDEFFCDIMDQGVGIAEENLRKIFDHFYQVDHGLARGHEGLGLGLAVTKLLLHAARGRITVDSSLGQGSTFTVIFPICEQEKQ